MLSMAGCSIWRLRKSPVSQFSTALFEDGNLGRRESGGKFLRNLPSLRHPLIRRTETRLVVGFYLPAVEARAKVVPLSSRATHAAKIYLPHRPFSIVSCFGYTFAHDRTHLLYLFHSNRFHIIWYGSESSFPLVHATGYKKKKETSTLFQSFSKKLPVPHRVVFRFISSVIQFRLSYLFSWLNHVISCYLV